MVNKPLECGRAWVEIDLNAIRFNINEIRSNVPDGCEIMAIVKANAYGHGAEKVAEVLYDEGIKNFAVSTVIEGMQIRKILPESNILVMGRANPGDAKFLNENNLTQLVSDGKHATELNDKGYKIDVHVAIDTGMHRLGIEPFNFEEIESIFKLKNLNVTGTATHLSSPDWPDEDDINYTKKQTDNFYTLIDKLKNSGYDPGKLHIQSSYGIYNCPELKCDYVRPGIMLYGVKSQNDETKIKTNLYPVLSLKAVIAQVRWIKTGECVSYGRKYIAENPIKIATVSIGYADGVPRQMSGNGGKAIVKGIIVPIIGRICMDMLILDVTGVDDVSAGDTAIFIGKDNKAEIRCEDVAEASGTISNDLLAGLGTRLPRVYK